MRTKKGIITSDSMDKTRVITVHSYKMHPKYKKRYRVSKKFYADDPTNSTKAGEEVIIYETKPLSKLKRWTVVKPEVKINVTEKQ
jgi:small subunit ribosomal protein S17